MKLQRQYARANNESGEVGHLALGSRHGVLRERLQRTMNKGTASAIMWARRKIADE
jgi:hypothetical protein